MGFVQQDSWRRRGNCYKSPWLTNFFFSKREEDVRVAKDICKPCNVKTECLLETLRFPTEAICAGMTERERVFLLAVLRPSKEEPLSVLLDRMFESQKQVRDSSSQNTYNPTLELLPRISISLSVEDQREFQVSCSLPPLRLQQTG